MSEIVESIFINKHVLLILSDGPIECVITDVVTELDEFYFYVCKLDGGDTLYQSVDSVLSVMIIRQSLNVV